MYPLQAGVDISVIALWLGHESPVTTHQYVEADLAMKERVLTGRQDPALPGSRHPDGLLEDAVIMKMPQRTPAATHRRLACAAIRFLPVAAGWLAMITTDRVNHKELKIDQEYGGNTLRCVQHNSTTSRYSESLWVF